MMKPEPAKKKTTGLGRGLSALLGEEQKSQDLASLDKMKQYKGVAIDLLEPNPLQPRHHFDEEALKDLTDSIKEKGVLQPLLVRRKPDNPDRFEIIAGERRFRAAQLAGLTEVPVLVRELDDQGALEVALIENLQRQDLTPLEEAEGYPHHCFT